MIRIKIIPTENNITFKSVYIDETTMAVDHYDDDVSPDQFVQAVRLIRKAIDSILHGMTFTSYALGAFEWTQGLTEYVGITISSNLIDIYPNTTNYIRYKYCVSYDDFKNLLIAQNKENELAYLMLRGFQYD